MFSIKKTTFKLIIFFIVLTLISCEIKEVKASNISIEKGELSLKQAIHLGLSRAKKWNAKASLLRINSVDETMGGSRGETGKRFNWHMLFIVPGTEDHLFVGISKGKNTVFKQLKQSGRDRTIAYKDIKFDSSDALKIAKGKFGLQPGMYWATGYHFTLDIIDDKPTVTIFGIDKNKFFTRINVDPRNGKVTSAIHKVANGGGLLSVHKGTNSPKLSKNGLAVMGITGRKNSLVTWGDSKPHQFNMAVQPFLELSKDNGESWTRLDIKQNVTQAWFDAQSKLYISTASGILTDLKSKSKGKKILSLEKDIEYLDYSPNNNIAVLSNGMIYVTVDQGGNWGKVTVPETLRTVQISAEGDLFSLTADGKVIRKNNDKWNTIDIPTRKEETLDMKIINNKLLISTHSGIWICGLLGDSWKRVPATEQITRLFKKGNNLFGLTDDGAIYLINVGQDTNGRINQLSITKDRIVMDLEMTENKLFIATIPDYIWEEMDSVSGSYLEKDFMQ